MGFIFAIIMTFLQAGPQEQAGIRLIIVRTEAEANAVSTRLQAGARFEDLAKTLSIDRSASAGGYIGTFAVAQLRPEFQAALAGLRPGQVSLPFMLGREFALIQLVTDEEIRAIALKDVRVTPSPRSVQQLWAMALSRNDVTRVRELLATGNSANVVYDDGSTVLMGAAQADQVEIVRALLAAGASVNAQAVDGTSALTLAAFGGRLQIVRMLLSAGGDVHLKLQDGSDALMKAAQGGDAEVVRTLLSAGASAATRAGNGLTALMEASFGGHIEIVRMLLQAKADVNAALENGSTALMAAAEKGRTDIAAALLSGGASVNAKSTTGGTALMQAAYSGHLETVRTLLQAGAEVNSVDSTGLTALMGTALGGHTDVAAALLEAGANSSLKDAKGWTALTHARASANPATIRLLLGKATDLSPQERGLILGSAYLNEYYSSNEIKLLDLGAVEFQKVVDAQPQNAAALEWLGAVEFLRWGDAPTLEQFKKAATPLRRSVELDSKDPDRHYWIAAISSIFVARGKGGVAADVAAIVDDGIEHGRRAIELDPEFADAMDHLSVLYRRKGENQAADTAHANAIRIRERRGNRPSRFNDQFSRPAVPPAPNL